MIHSKEVPRIEARHLMVMIIIQFDLQLWSKNRPPHPDPWNQRPQRPWSPHPPTDVCCYIWTICTFNWARQLVPFPFCLSIPFRLPWPTFPAPFATSDDCWSLTFLQKTKLLPMKPYLLFAFLAGRKSDPFIFPKIFTNLSAHPCHKYSPQNLPSSVVLPKHWTLQEFWHIYQLILYLHVWVFSLSKMRFPK